MQGIITTSTEFREKHTMAELVVDNALILKTFEAVAERRNLMLREVLELCDPKDSDREEVRSRIHESLEQLVAEGLVSEEEAPIEDFSVYYITTSGLRMYRRLKRAGLLENGKEPKSGSQ
jgi:hypothetical protein